MNLIQFLHRLDSSKLSYRRSLYIHTYMSPLFLLLLFFVTPPHLHPWYANLFLTVTVSLCTNPITTCLLRVYARLRMRMRTNESCVDLPDGRKVDLRMEACERQVPVSAAVSHSLAKICYFHPHLYPAFFCLFPRSFAPPALLSFVVFRPEDDGEAALSGKIVVIVYWYWY